MQPKVRIYSKNYCPHCVRAKDFFVSRGVAIEEIDVTHDPIVLEKLIKQTQHMTVPQIFIGDSFVGGYTDLMAKIQRGEIVL